MKIHGGQVLPSLNSLSISQASSTLTHPSHSEGLADVQVAVPAQPLPKKLEQYPREVSPLGEGLSLFMVPGYLREFTRDRPNWPLTDLPHLDLSHPVLDWREKGEGRRENTNQKAGLETCMLTTIRAMPLTSTIIHSLTCT